MSVFRHSWTYDIFSINFKTRYVTYSDGSLRQVRDGGQSNRTAHRRRRQGHKTADAVDAGSGGSVGPVDVDERQRFCRPRRLVLPAENAVALPRGAGADGCAAVRLG